MSFKCTNKLIRNGHSFRGNHFYIRIKYHAITLNIRYNLLFELYKSDPIQEIKNSRRYFTGKKNTIDGGIID
jgi:hypothetical protein